MAKQKSTKFISQGVGVHNKTKPISVMLPPELEEIVKSQPNRSEWLRKAIRNQAIVDGLIEDTEERAIAC